MRSRLASLLRTPEWVALAALAVFTVTSVFGYWNFALHPERLPSSPTAVKFFSISFQFFARLHILLAAVALGVFLARTVGWRWLLALAAVFVLSFTAEHVGTGYGIPFGGYGYTGLLGAKLGGRVPALIPLSWFLMALPSWILAKGWSGAPSSRGARILLGALWLTVWDLALDPAMSYLTPYWVWEESGPYFGMPWINLAGWYLTGLFLMVALEALAGYARLGSVPVRWTAAYYGLVLALPVGMVAAAGLWSGVVATLGGVALAAGLTHLAGRMRVSRSFVGAPSAVGAR